MAAVLIEIQDLCEATAVREHATAEDWRRAQQSIDWNTESVEAVCESECFGDIQGRRGGMDFEFKAERSFTDADVERERAENPDPVLVVLTRDFKGCPAGTFVGQSPSEAEYLVSLGVARYGTEADAAAMNARLTRKRHPLHRRADALGGRRVWPR